MLLKCSSVQNLLSDYLDGILSEKQANLISQHLSHCQRCQRELQSLEATVEALNFYVEKTPPDGYFEQVWPNLQARIEERTTQQSLQGIATLLGLKASGLRTKLLFQYEQKLRPWREKLKETFQWRSYLFKFAVVACLVLIGIFVDRAFRPTANEIILERLKNSFYSDNHYSVRFASQKANSSRKTKSSGFIRMPLSKISDGSRSLDEASPIKAIEIINSSMDNIPDDLPALRWQIKDFEFDMNGGKLTLVLDVSKLTDDSDTSTQEPPIIAHLSSPEPVADSSVSSLKDPDLPEPPRVIGESKRFSSLLNVTPNLSSAEVYNLEKFEGKID